jgi:hypothetical protein
MGRSPHGSEAACYGASYSSSVIPGSAVDDEVALPRRPLVPALEHRLKAVPESTRDGFPLRAGEHRSVDRYGLPALEPLRQRGHTRQL